MQLIAQVNDEVRARFIPYGINVIQISVVGEPIYPEEIRKAIIAKIQATQNALTRENELRETKAEAEKKIARRRRSRIDVD